MNKLKIAGFALFIITLQACKQKPVSYNDTISEGSAKFAADESFQPIVDAENYIFKALDPKAKPELVYKPENMVVNMLLQDSVRVAILSRTLDSSELKVLKTKNLSPDIARFAVDAVAVIVNKASNDTTITVDAIKKMLNGQAKSAKNIVFDNPNSSLVRYLKTLSGVSDFKLSNIFALKSNKEVIRYVSTHPDAIGFVGFNWLDDPDKDYADAVNNIKIVGVKDEANQKYANGYYTPSQETLSLGQYPLKRDLYIINCTGRQGLGTGFELFLTSDRGQRIVLTSGLLPSTMPGREIEIKHTTN
ncbi:PstS family phosphate ABC transporter substrate-binding protein [Mucilaginibacter sp.]